MFQYESALEWQTLTSNNNNNNYNTTINNSSIITILHFSISAFTSLFLYFNLDKSYLFQSNSTDFQIHLTFFS